MALPKKKIKISMLIMAVIIIVFSAAAVYPLIREIKKISGQILSVKGDLSLLQAQIQNLEIFEKQSHDYQENIDKIGDLFIDPQVPIDFFEFLEKEALNAGLSLSITPAPGSLAKGDLWPSLNIQLVLDGPFPKFFLFLERLESSPYLVEVKSLGLTRITQTSIVTQGLGNTSVGDVQAKLSIKVYTK